jgi:uncharacterized protein
MTRQSILNTLRTSMAMLHKDMGVKTIALFGSYARDEAMPDSDLDILVELETADFQSYIKLKVFLEKNFPMSVDLLRRGPHLSPKFLASIEPELIYA